MTKLLDLPMREENDAQVTTVREYLIKLLSVTFEDPPKRPFGNSDWNHDLPEALYDAGLLDDPDDWREADRLIQQAIQELGEK